MSSKGQSDKVSALHKTKWVKYEKVSYNGQRTKWVIKGKVSYKGHKWFEKDEVSMKDKAS